MSEYEKVVDLIFGRWKSQIMYTGVKLGIFNLDLPMNSNEIAQKLKLDPSLTYRLLRALASIQLLKEGDNSIFSITPMGKFLQNSNPQSLQGIALLEEGPEHYSIWKHLPEMIKDGNQDGFKREFGHKIFEHVEIDPSYADVFNKAMSSYSAAHTKWVLEALNDYEFTGISHICDVGGGHGHLICHILLNHRNIKGTVLELAQTIKNKDLLWTKRLGISQEQCNYVAGDMFMKVPSADAYLLKMILHDWSDEQCVKILSNIKNASSKGSRIFIIEHIIPEPEVSHFSKLFDIHMMCALTGRERTEKEYSELLDKAGLRYVRTSYPPSKSIGVIEGINP